LIDATHNVIVFTDAVDDIGAALTTINGGDNAAVGDGVIVIAAASAAGSFAKIWYDATVDAVDTVELATLTNVLLSDLASFTVDNFSVI
jgi:hypothetical protein